MWRWPAIKLGGPARHFSHASTSFLSCWHLAFLNNVPRNGKNWRAGDHVARSTAAGLLAGC